MAVQKKLLDENSLKAIKTYVDNSIPTVNNATLTIQKNGTTVNTFTANASTNVTANITVPTKTSELTNDSSFLTAHQAIKTLKTDNTAAQSTSSSEVIAGSGTINLHKVAKTGTYSDLIDKPTIPTVNNGTLTIKAGGTSKGTFTANQSSNTTIDITASDLGLSSAMKFIGTTTSSISDGSTTNPIVISGSNVTATSGNVVLKGNKEFVWTGSAWEELGDESSHALNTVTITGTGALGGGGSLAANRTITHNEILGTAQTTSALYAVKLDKYGHVTYAVAAKPSDIPNLEASKITSGTFDAARLPSTVAYTNEQNTFIEKQTFTSTDDDPINIQFSNDDGYALQISDIRSTNSGFYGIDMANPYTSNNNTLTLPDASGTFALNSINNNFTTAQTMPECIVSNNVGSVDIRADGEGGNITMHGPSSTDGHVEMDCYNGNFRLYKYTTSGGWVYRNHFVLTDTFAELIGALHIRANDYSGLLLANNDGNSPEGTRMRMRAHAGALQFTSDDTNVCSYISTAGDVVATGAIKAGSITTSGHNSYLDFYTGDGKTFGLSGANATVYDLSNLSTGALSATGHVTSGSGFMSNLYYDAGGNSALTMNLKVPTFWKNGYGTRYVCLSTTKLWTGSSSTTPSSSASSWAGGNIDITVNSIQSSDVFKFYIILYDSNWGTRPKASSIILPWIGGEQFLNCNVPYSSGAGFINTARSVSISDISSGSTVKIRFTFGHGYNGLSLNDSACIPLEIYGVM